MNFLVQICLMGERGMRTLRSPRSNLYIWYAVIGTIHAIGMWFFDNYEFSSNFWGKLFQFLWLILLWPYYLIVYSWPLLIAIVLLACYLLYYFFVTTPQRPRSNVPRAPW